MTGGEVTADRGLGEPMTGGQAGAYQRLRAHLAYLKLPTSAEALPAVLDAARAEGLSVTAALERLLNLEVTATEDRRMTGRGGSRTPPPPGPSTNSTTTPAPAWTGP